MNFIKLIAPRTGKSVRRRKKDKRIDLCRDIDHIFAGIKYSGNISYKWVVINHSVSGKFFSQTFSSKLLCFCFILRIFNWSLGKRLHENGSAIDYDSIWTLILLGNYIDARWEMKEMRRKFLNQQLEQFFVALIFLKLKNI